jgi:hypothetical protein
VNRKPRLQNLPDKIAAALKLLKNPIPPRPIPVLDDSELRHILTTFFNTPRSVLNEEESLGDLKAISREASRSVRVRPNPTTGNTLSDLLTWAELERILRQLDERSLCIIALTCGRPIWSVDDIEFSLIRIEQENGHVFWQHNPAAFTEEEREMNREKLASFRIVREKIDGRWRIAESETTAVFNELKQALGPYLE